MKNFNIDAILKSATTIFFIGLYGVAGFFVVRILITPSTVAPIVSEPVIVMETGTITPTAKITVSPSPPTFQNEPLRVTQVPKSTVTVITMTPTPDSRCKISVDGVSYDVTAFRTTHSGGDIFTCGADMTATFYGQHSANMLRNMERYKL